MTILSQLTPRALNELYVGRRSEFDQYLYSNGSIITQTDGSDQPSQYYVVESYRNGVGATSDPIRSTLIAIGDEFNQFQGDVVSRKAKFDRRGMQTSVDRKTADNLAKLEDALVNDCAHMVASGHELELEQILRGNGNADISRDVSTLTLEVGQQFSNTSSNIIENIMDAQSAYAGQVLVLGYDVASAMAKHPDLRGTQNRALTIEEVRQFWLGYGFLEVWISPVTIATQGSKKAFTGRRLFNGVCAMFKMGNLESHILDPMTFDSEVVKTRDSNVLMAHEYRGYVVHDPSFAVAFLNTLA